MEFFLMTLHNMNKMKMIIIAIVIGSALTGCKNAQQKEVLNHQDSLTIEIEQTEDTIVAPLNMFGIALQGESKEEVIDKLLNQVNIIKLVEHSDNVTVVNFNGIECGLNISLDSIPNQVSATSVLLLTSKKNKTTFEQLKKGIEQYYGEPDVEDYEEGEKDMDGHFSGRCNWYRECDIVLRHLHTEDGGFSLIFSLRQNK